MNKTKNFFIKSLILHSKNEFLYIYENEEGINQTRMKFILNNIFFMYIVLCYLW